MASDGTAADPELTQFPVTPSADPGVEKVIPELITVNWPFDDAMELLVPEKLFDPSNVISVKTAADAVLETANTIRTAKLQIALFIILQTLVSKNKEMPLIGWQPLRKTLPVGLDLPLIRNSSLKFQ